MKLTSMIAGFALLTLASTAMAEGGSCEDRAAEKKLAGAAKTSFLKKCNAEAANTEAATQCATAAEEKKLAGAAKNSFTKKCLADAQKKK